jgi:hypothetical protein
MAIRKTSDSNLTGKKYNDASAGSAKIADVPETPTIDTVANVGTSRAYNNGAATVAVTANTRGGIPTSFIVASDPGAFTGTGSSPVTVTGLQSGVSYTFTAKAVGGSGSTETTATTASSSITATTVPQAPTSGTATKTNATTVSIPFTVNATGGSSITSYLVQSTPSIALSVSGSSSPLTVTGSFVQNQAYTFDVIAVNANGSSLGGTTNSVTPNAVPTADGDTFTRTTTLTLGATTTSGQSWVNRAGVWYANGTRAQSDSATPAIATITMNSNFGTTKAGSLTPGTGLVYWATDANRYMATYSFSTSGTSNSCGGYSSNGCSGNGCNPGGCCTGVSYSCSSTYIQYSDNGSSAPRGPLGCSCNNCFGEEQARWAFCCNVGNFNQSYSGSCGTNATVTTVTNYMRTIKVESGSATTIEDFSMGNATAISSTTAADNAPRLASMSVVTNSNGSLTIVGYPSDNYGGTAYTTRSLSPTFATKSNNFGIIKATSGVITQGSTVDSFETTGF